MHNMLLAVEVGVGTLFLLHVINGSEMLGDSGLFPTLRGSLKRDSCLYLYNLNQLPPSEWGMAF